MKAILSMIGLIGLSLLAGCVASLNPVYTDETMVFEPALVGLWVQDHSPATWNLAARGDKEYMLLHTDENGEEARFVVHLTKIEEEMFLDVVPENLDIGGNAYSRLHVLPIHTIYRLRRSGSGFELAAINLQWFEEYLTTHPETIAHATINGRKVITAPTNELRAFLFEHQDAFTSPLLLKRKVENPRRV